MSYLKFDKTELVNLEYSLPKEYLLANKLGVYSNSTIVGCNTRGQRRRFSCGLGGVNRCWRSNGFRGDCQVADGGCPFGLRRFQDLDLVPGHGAPQIGQGPAGLENNGFVFVHVMQEKYPFTQS